MITRFSDAFCLLGRHFGLFAAIILTVWLPGNLLINYVAYNVEAADEITFMKMTLLIEAILGPIYIGALVHSLFQIKSGHPVTYTEAVTVGMRKWGWLLAARFVAGILMCLGLVALVIPGIVLAVRYSLLDAAVVIEGKGTSESRARSTFLTEGRRWQIFWTAVVFFIAFMVISFLLYLLLGFFESLNTMAVDVLLDCILDIGYAVLQIVIFLFYWEAKQEQRTAEPSAGAHGLQPAAQP